MSSKTSNANADYLRSAVKTETGRQALARAGWGQLVALCDEGVDVGRSTPENLERVAKDLRRQLREDYGF